MAHGTAHDGHGADGVEKLVIIGSGPAGWTCAIYAARANLKPLVYEGTPSQSLLPGGQLMFTTEVENYPGFPHGIQGPEMMAKFREQAARFETRIVTDDIVEVDFRKRPFTLKSSEGTVIRTHAVVIATGAKANWLNLPNEQRLAQNGGGVSACAVCDGALPVFRDQHLAVVGGGDTAMEEASYLMKFASMVHLIHRRGEFRASKAMAARILESKKATVHWWSQVVDVVGKDFIEAIVLEDVRDKKRTKLPVKGLFIAIGHTPLTGFLGGQITTDDKGYVKIADPWRTTTNVEGVFAAGDVADSTYRQAITAAGMGCKAALDAERWLATQGIH
jgi:thioredoxin reductase (NADPH)